MLVFIDESGDTGRRIEKGSSLYFIVSMVIFIDHEEAVNLDTRVNLLRKELKLSPNYEFHFSKNSERIRKAFLTAINLYNFTYITIAINKDPKRLFGEGFNHKEAFYKYACNMLFTNATPYLEKATVILDRSGSADFRNELSTYLRRNFNRDHRIVIEKIKQQRSDSNNLLQVVDYITGVMNRKINSKGDWENYYKYISPRELQVQIWPK